jgi:hypothetical protein
VSGGAAQIWFIAGTIPLILGGGLHALAALLDTVRPTFFAPIEDRAMPALEGTGIRLRRMFPGGSGATPSMWRVWLGIHISHGLGVFAFGLLCLLIAAHDFNLVVDIDAIRPLTIAFSAAYLTLSLRFWFYGPAILTGSATACFSIAYVLSL